MASKPNKYGHVPGFSDAQQAFRMELGERLTHVLAAFDSRTQASEIAGVGVDQLAGYVAGRNKIPLEVAARLTAARGFSLSWLATGEGGPRDMGDELQGFALIPIYDVRASSGHGAFAPENAQRSHLAFGRAWLRNVIRVPEKQLCVLFNTGESNAPDIDDGDALLVDQSIERIVDDAFYVFNRDGSLLVKRIERLVTGGIKIKPRNPDFSEEVLSREEAAEVRIFGRVRWAAGLI